MLLHHYCSVASFFGIITNKVIFISDAFSSNDHTEGKWWMTYVYKVIGERVERNRALYSDVINTLRMNESNHFVSCFSENGDMLSQWRAYGEDGQGFSIAFNSEYFNAKDSLPHLHATTAGSLFLNKVMYPGEEDLGRLGSELHANLDEIESSGKGVMHNSYGQLMFICNGLSKLTKNPCFSEEKEWRLVYMPMIMSKEGGEEFRVFNPISDLKWRSSSGRIIPYFLLSLDEDRVAQAVAKVTIGPKCLESVSRTKMFLDAHGFHNVEVVRSSASYR